MKRSQAKTVVPLVPVRVTRLCAYLPTRVVSNADLLHHPDPPHVILRKTGIEHRRAAEPGEGASHLGARALGVLLGEDKHLAGRLGQLVVATSSPDCPTPATASFIHHSLGLPRSVPGCDVVSSCSSFLSALRLGAGFVAATGKALALVAAEVKSSSLGSWDHRAQSLFGDGAVAMILEPAHRDGFVFPWVSHQSEGAQWVHNPVGGSREPVTIENLGRCHLRLSSPRELYRRIIETMREGILCSWDERKRLVGSGDIPGDIVVHQANGNILSELQETLPRDLASRVSSGMRHRGNTLSASIPLRVVERRLAGALHTRELATGRLTWAAGEAWIGLLDGAREPWVPEAPPQAGPRSDVWVSVGGGFQGLSAVTMEGL